jgi:hypothetical protein
MLPSPMVVTPNPPAPPDSPFPRLLSVLSVLSEPSVLRKTCATPTTAPLASFFPYLATSLLPYRAPATGSPSPGSGLSTNHQPRTTNSFTIRTYEKHARNPFRIRTYRTQDLKSFRMNTYKKNQGGPPSHAQSFATPRRGCVTLLDTQDLPQTQSLPGLTSSLPYTPGWGVRAYA